MARIGSNVLRAVLLALFAFAIFGPLLNLVLWAFAERWYFPSKLPMEYGFTFWERVFAPRGNAIASLGTSIWIALLTVAFSLAVAIPAGYALARLKLPWRTAILLAFLMPQAFPSLAVYINIARIFYDFKLNGTMLGVILVHTVHGLVFAVWITVGYFEVEKAPDWNDSNATVKANVRARFGATLNDADPATIAGLALYNRVYPNGYMLGREVGSDTGDVKRPRGFYIIDRTEEVGFKPGEDLNVDKLIRLRRRIE